MLGDCFITVVYINYDTDILHRSSSLRLVFRHHVLSDASLFIWKFCRLYVLHGALRFDKSPNTSRTTPPDQNEEVQMIHYEKVFFLNSFLELMSITINSPLKSPPFMNV